MSSHCGISCYTFFCVLFLIITDVLSNFLSGAANWDDMVMKFLRGILFLSDYTDLECMRDSLHRMLFFVFIDFVFICFFIP